MVVVDPDDPDELSSWGIVGSQEPVVAHDATPTQQQGCGGGLPAIRSGSRCGSRPGSRANGGSRCSSRTLQHRRRHVAAVTLQHAEPQEPSPPPTPLGEALVGGLLVVSTTSTSPEPTQQPPLQQQGSGPQETSSQQNGNLMSGEFSADAGGSLPGLLCPGPSTPQASCGAATLAPSRRPSWCLRAESSLLEYEVSPVLQRDVKECDRTSSATTNQSTPTSSSHRSHTRNRRVPGPVRTLSHLRLDVLETAAAQAAPKFHNITHSRGNSQSSYSSVAKSMRTTTSKASHGKRYPAPWCGQCTTRLKNPNLHCSVRIFPDRKLRDAQEMSLNRLKARKNQPVLQDHQPQTLQNTGVPLSMSECEPSAFSRKPHDKFGGCMRHCDIGKLELHLIQQKLKLPHMLRSLARAEEEHISESGSSDASLNSEDSDNKLAIKGRFETLADRLEVLKNLHLASLRTIVRMKVEKRSEADLELMCKYFKSCKFFKILPQPVIESVTKSLELRRHEIGDVIYGERQPVHGIYLIIKGKVALVAGEYTVESHIALSEGTTVMNFRRHTLGGQELLDLGGLRDPGRWVEALYMWTAIAQVQSETLFLPLDSLLTIMEDYNINQVIEACRHLPLLSNNPREHFFRPSRVRRENRRITFHRLFQVDEFIRNTVFQEEEEIGNPATARIHVLIEGKVHFRRFGGVVCDLPIGTSFGQEALKNTRYSCTATVASRVARLLSISVADYITQFLDGVAPVRTATPDSNSEGGHESVSAPESSSSEDVPPNAPARARIFARRKYYTNVRGQVKELTEDMKKRWRRRADREAIRHEMWREAQPRRAPRRVEPGGAVVPRSHSSMLPHNQGHACSGEDNAGETGILGGLKTPSRAGARSSARKTPPKAVPRCQTASTCAPAPSVARTLASVSPTRPSTSGTSMPSPRGCGASRPSTSGTSMPSPRGCGAMQWTELDILPFMVTAWRPQTSDPDITVTSDAASRDQQLVITEHCIEPHSH